MKTGNRTSNLKNVFTFISLVSVFILLYSYSNKLSSEKMSYFKIDLWTDANSSVRNKDTINLVDSIPRERLENYYRLLARTHKTLGKQLIELYRNKSKFNLYNLYKNVKNILKVLEIEKYTNIKNHVSLLEKFLFKCLSRNLKFKPEDSEFRMNILALMAKIELLLDSDRIREFKKDRVKNFQDELLARISSLQKSDCLKDDTLAAVLPFEKNAVGCGYGCQMHFLSSVFICATDKKRMFFIDNYEIGQYNKYFELFAKKCEGTVDSRNDTYIEGSQEIQGKHPFCDIMTYTGRNFKKDLSNEFKYKVDLISWIQEPYAWVHGQFFMHILKETQYLKQYVEDYAKDLKLDFNLPFVGMNIRRGLKVAEGFKEADAYEFKEYMAHAKDFYEKYFMKHPDQLGKIAKTIFISTEDPSIIEEMKNYTEYNFLFNASKILHANEQLINRVNYVWDPLMGIVDMLILNKADLVIATHSSNFARLIYENMHIDDPDPFYKFISLDKDYFIHGYRDQEPPNPNIFLRFLDYF